MSKAVKELVAQDIARRLGGVEDCVIGNMIGLDSGTTSTLRRQLREKKINVLVVKNSLARLATRGTRLAPAFEGLSGMAAVLYGAEDFVSLVKEAVKLHDDDKLPAFEARGGVMDGERLSSEQVKQISKWPSRQEQLSILAGQILSPGAQLSSQLLAMGGALASQIDQAGEKNG